MPGDQDGARTASLHRDISDAVVRITAEYTGRGPTRARTTINGDWIFVTPSDTLTKGERKLAEAGRMDFVREARRAYQDVMREEVHRRDRGSHRSPRPGLPLRRPRRP